MTTLSTSQNPVDLIDPINGVVYRNLIYTGTRNAILIGNEYANQITGGPGDDEIEGGGNADTLYGGEGNDILWGFYFYYDSELGTGSEVNYLIEQENSNRYLDKLYGGKGDDAYVLDQYVHRSAPPEIYEFLNEGVDTIFGDVGSYTLPANVENYVNDLNLTANGVPVAMTINGNALNNILQSSPPFEVEDVAQLLTRVNEDWMAKENFYGLEGDDTILAGGGDDILSGGEGADSLKGGGGDDLIIGGPGTDIAIFYGSSSQYLLTYSSTGVHVLDQRAGSPDGEDMAQEVEILRFSDKDISLSSTNVTVDEILVLQQNIGLYRLSDDFLSFIDTEISVGETVWTGTRLYNSAEKPFTLKLTPAAILNYDDGSFGLVSGSGTKWTEQRFTSDGVTSGGTTKLTLDQIFDKETAFSVDINGGGLGDTISEVIDADGYVGGSNELALYKGLSGRYVIDELGKTVAQNFSAGAVTVVSGSKNWSPKGAILGITETSTDSIEVILLKGSSHLVQRINIESGALVGSAAKIKDSDELASRECYYNLDINGDGQISLVGADDPPANWAL
jgi:RTX calcium-binding nonapeptide repeat (4 copies)